MGTTVLILHAKGDEEQLGWLENALRNAGYDVAHRGTVLVGESEIEAVDQELFKEGPVVLFGTCAAVGSARVKKALRAARAIGGAVRVFPIKVDDDADLTTWTFDDIKPADCSSDAKRQFGIDALLKSLRKYSSPGVPAAAPHPLARWERLAERLAKNNLVLALQAAFAQNAPGVQPFLEAIGAAAELAEAAGAAVPSAPWSSAEWPLRVVEQIEIVWSRLGEQKKIEPAEIALLLASPFLVHRLIEDRVTQLSALEGGAEPPAITTDYGRFLSGHQRIVDLVGETRKAGDTALASVIQGWLRLRFVEEQRRAWGDDDVSGLLGGIAKSADLQRLFEPDSISKLLRMGALGPRDLTELHDSDPVRFLGRQIEIHWRLLGAILLLAERITLRPGALSETILYHLGPRRGLPLDQLCEDVDRAWVTLHTNPAVLALRAECHAPAVDHALTELAGQLDRLVRDDGSILHQTLQPHGFHGIQRCETAIIPRKKDGRACYTTPLVRFEMDPDDVRQLLMGTQLWGDPSHAFRELYQNALDACRYRRCRSQFKDVGYDPWIRFHDGVTAEGRRYVECEDNGIGMTLEHIRTCFARAGRRFATTTEFQRELAEWKAKGIEMTPNSQFGIGVFSYFLVAEEIEVETCRLAGNAQDRERRLLVRIPTASSLFTVTELSDDDARAEQRRRQGERGDELNGRLDAGTRVRLLLAPDVKGKDGEKLPTAQETLRALVWFTEVTLRATTAGLEQVAEWRAGRLAPWIQEFAEEVEGESRHWWVIRKFDTYESSDILVASSQSEVFVRFGGNLSTDMNRYRGRVLADGIATKHSFPCAIVNLSGSEGPHFQWTARRSARRFLTQLPSAFARPSRVGSRAEQLTSAGFECCGNPSQLNSRCSGSVRGRPIAHGHLVARF